MIKKIKLPDGSTKDFKVPDDWSNEQITEAAANYFNLSKPQEESPKENQSETNQRHNQALLRYGVKAPLVGASEMMRNLKNFLGAGIYKEPEIDYSNFITPTKETNLAEHVIHAIPEFATAVSLPATRAPSIINDVSTAGKYLKSALQSKPVGHAITQGTFAATQSPENAAQAGLTAGGITAPLVAAGEYAFSKNPATRFLSKILSPTKSTTENVFKGVEGTPYAENLEKARNLKMRYLTPAEASGNKLSAEFQGKTGVTTEASKLFEKEAQQRLQSERQSIQDLYNGISPTTKNAPHEVRTAAQNELKSLKETRATEAAPHYKKSELQKIPPAWVKNLEEADPNIKGAINSVLKDKRYQKEGELLNVPKNTIKVLDYAKRRLDSQIRAGKDAGHNDLVRILLDSKNNLVEKIDSFNKNYKKSRAVYAEYSKPVDIFKENELGRISNLKDTQLKQVSSQIFDPAQTDLNVLKNIKNTVQKQDPKAWDKIVRYHFEKMMGKKTDVNGTTFYNTVLSNPQRFNQFVTALEDRPDLAKKLYDMRDVFKNLINPESVKGAAKLSKTSISDPRSTMQAFSKFIKQKFGEKYDTKAVKLMTSPEWDKELSKLNSVSQGQKQFKELYDALVKIGAQGVSKSQR